MTTALDIKRERYLLTGMGLKPIKVWLPRCTWYNPDGSVHGDLPCDPYSRLLYLGRGLRPGVAVDATPPSLQCNSLQDAVVKLMDDSKSWDGTATELLSILNGSVDGIPGDATRLSKALAKLASSLSDAGITVARTRTKHARRISITRR